MWGHGNDDGDGDVGVGGASHFAKNQQTAINGQTMNENDRTTAFILI